jgi:hypothetical protein
MTTMFMGPSSEMDALRTNTRRLALALRSVEAGGVLALGIGDLCRDAALARMARENNANQLDTLEAMLRKGKGNAAAV